MEWLKKNKFLLILFFPLLISFDGSNSLYGARSNSWLFYSERTGDVDNEKVSLCQSDLEKYIRLFSDKGYFPSFCVGVITDNKLSYNYCYKTNLVRTYSIASITKTFTATAVMQLVEKGKVDLDAPISKYLPGVRIEKKELNSPVVTVRHLLSHTSGLPDIRYYNTPDCAEVGKLKLKVPSQIYPAGRHYRYANHGFKLLGHLVEKVSGLSYKEYLKKNIFIPAGMENADTSKQVTGAGGILVSLTDLTRYAIIWLNDGIAVTGKRILQSHSIAQMLELQLYIPYAKSKRYVGLGWRVESDKNGVITFFHIGGDYGVSAWIQMFPRYNTAVVYLGNPGEYKPIHMSFLTAIQNKLADLATQMVGAYKPVNEFNPSLPTPDIIKKLEGDYCNPITYAKATVYQKNNHLYFKSDRENVKLDPYTTHIFLGGAENLSYDFVFKPGYSRPDGVATFYGFFNRMDSIDQCNKPTL